MNDSAGWERVYRERGEIYSKVLPKIRRSVGLFRERGYERVLDLACGTGKHSIYLAKRGFTVYATDVSPTGVSIAREKALAQGLDIYFRVHDMKIIPFPEEFFDAVICTWSIHHGTVAEIRQTVDEIYRVLKRGGTVLTDLPSITTWDCGHGMEIEPNTYIHVNEEERDVPHHYGTRQEVLGYFHRFASARVRLVSRRSPQVEEDGEIHISKLYNVTAVK